MNLLTWFRPAPTRAPGRHTPAWAAMQQGVLELQQRAQLMEGERDAARSEVEQLKQRHAQEISGWQDALRKMSAESRGIAADLERAEAERDRLQRLLDASDGRPAHMVPAPIEQGCRDTPRATAETVRDVRLPDLAETGEYGLTADLLSGQRITWGVNPSLRPRMPDETPTQRMASVTAVLPLWDQTIPVVVPAEVSRTTGERAVDSVHAALAT